MAGGGGNSTAPTRLAGVQVSTSAAGLVIPKVWGTGRLKVNMLWYGNFTSTANKTSGGKGGGSTTTGYNYSAAVILGICAGPISAVTAVYVNKSVFASPTAAGLSLATGALGQSVWGWLATNAPTQAIGYSGIAYLYAPSYSLGTSGSTPNVSMEVKSSYTYSGLPDCLPDVILTDFLTNATSGVPGWPAGVLGSLTNYSTYCLAANLLLSPVIDTQVTAASFIDDLMASTNSACFWSEGLFKVTPLGDATVTGNSTTWNPSLSPAYALTDNSFLVTAMAEPPIYVDISDQTDAYNIVQVEFLDRTNQYNTAIASRQDDSNIAQYGPRKQNPKTLHMICDPTVANNVAQIILQQTLYIRGQYHFTLPWSYALLEQTDLVTITDAGMGLSNFLVRIVQIDDDESSCRAITAVEVPVGVASPPVYAHQDSSGYTPGGGVAASAVAVPYIFNPPSTLTAGGQETWIAVAGSVPSTWGGCNVWTSLDGTNYQMVGVIAQPSRYGVTTATFTSGSDPDVTNTLSVDLTASAASLATATAADENGLVTLCMVENELVAYQTATLTSAYHYGLTSLRRGAMGTAISSHAAGSAFVRLDGAPFVVPFNAANVGQTVYVKLQSFNPVGGGVQDISTCSVYTIVPATTPAGTAPGGNDSSGNELGSTSNQTFVQSTDPALTVTVRDGAFWYNSTTGMHYQRHAGAWIAINGAVAGTVLFDSALAGAWSYTIPLTGTGSAQVEIWGGGGGAFSNQSAGGGGYATRTYTVTPGATVFSGTIGSYGLGKDVSIGQVATSGTATTLTTGGTMTANGGALGATGVPGVGGTATGGTTNTTGTSGTATVGGGAGNGGGNQSVVGDTGTYPGGGGAAGVPAGDGERGRVVITAR